jgi:hypothetical protein
VELTALVLRGARRDPFDPLGDRGTAHRRGVDERFRRRGERGRCVRAGRLDEQTVGHRRGLAHR